VGKRYLLDTSFLVNGWRKHYRIDVFPSIWERLDNLMQDSTVFSCYEVFEELKAKDDELHAWAAERRKLFERPKPIVLKEIAKVMQQFPTFAAKGTSLNAADPWVIAHARACGATIVTDENSNPKASPTKPPKIPDVCRSLVIECLKPIDFLSAIGIKL
jgi:hypothetical protein